MVRIAVLSEQLAAQLRTVQTAGGQLHPELSGIDVVWAGGSPTEFRQRVPALRPQVLVVDLAQVSTGSEARRSDLDALLSATGAELALVLYSFAPREQLRQISALGERARALKAPLSLAALRLNMLSLLVRDTFQSGDAFAAISLPLPQGTSVAAPTVAQGGNSSSSRPRLIGGDDDFGAPLPVGSARLFTAQQLGRLQEISSSVRCECPNHLAELVSSLAAFEEYSKKCESRDAGDAAIHAKLYRETSRARRLMEEALIALCRYERIDL
jgi:hypothetical protein